MRKLSVSVNTLFLTSTLFIASCGGSNEQKTTEIKPEKDTLTVKKEKEAPEEKPIVSLTKKEAEAKMKAFLKENRRKYDDEGTLDEIELTSGNFNSDGALDYFFKVGFAGGDFIYRKHFFYNSELDKIEELEVKKTPEFLKSIMATEITEGKIKGEISFWNAYSYDIYSERNVNAEFTIEGKYIILDNKYLPKFKKAAKEITKELDQMQQEMMENADGINSSEEVDY
jgi:hypothetical protein